LVVFSNLVPSVVNPWSTAGLTKISSIVEPYGTPLPFFNLASGLLYIFDFTLLKATLLTKDDINSFIIFLSDVIASPTCERLFLVYSGTLVE
jgi:hypothetical protein